MPTIVEMDESAQKSGEMQDAIGLAHLTSASAYMPHISKNSNAL